MSVSLWTWHRLTEYSYILETHWVQLVDTHGVEAQWVEQNLLDAHCLETFPRLLPQTHRQLATEEEEEEEEKEEEEDAF